VLSLTHLGKRSLMRKSSFHDDESFEARALAFKKKCEKQEFSPICASTVTTKSPVSGKKRKMNAARRKNRRPRSRKWLLRA